MANSMMNRAKGRQDEKQAKEKDPADLSGLQEPDWGSPEQSSPDSAASESASGNASAPTDEKPTSPSPSTTSGRTPRRRGRPRGPQRVPLSVRILADNDRRLTAAVDELHMNPQSIVDEALALYFKRMKIHDPRTQ